MTASHYAPDTLQRPVNWVTRSLCSRSGVDRALWYSADPAERQEARDWCEFCPVREECLEETMRVEGNAPAKQRFGIFAGLDGEERYELRMTGTVAEQVTRNGRPPAKCGTESAYQRHVREGEPIDAACRAAHNVQAAKYRARARS
ncbi:WhiB family transcriptional regulator [Streptomyces sp. URMC 124]|uniref:WhiB family transcriptional regulator n=1 Tax=Streptomyces sp. URMC 124 TaxID=3423405 RepID=UPI003F1D5E25